MIELTESPIDAGAVLAQVADSECGAEVLFVGTTRQWTDVRPQREADVESQTEAGQRIETSHLIYESYREMALVQMRRLEDEARSRWPLRKVVMVHRLGRIAATEASVAIAVSSPHRSEAFDAARWLIDELKHHVPIWKQEHYVQHGPQWIHPTAGNCHCPEHTQPHQTSQPHQHEHPQPSAWQLSNAREEQ
ncbi:MAG: molybdenum cofactor biosynthesis protein MoaE [Planctomycetales bacterium]|nr:molybdenum cofactor biosynthesis protein MoaE [Planctomycetales bacterium]